MVRLTNNIELILTVFDEMFPNAECELLHKTNFQLLIAVVLSAQTTDESVNKVTPHLFIKYPDPQTLADAEIEVVENIIRKIGLYKTKARNIIEISKIIRDNHDGVVPEDFNELVKLPGVGRKTANVVTAVAFNKPAFAVDTHVLRVSKRLGLADASDKVDQVEEKLKKIFPKERWVDLHHKFIFFGRYHCTARIPKCNECILQCICKEF